jgi:hypothetical protein
MALRLYPSPVNILKQQLLCYKYVEDTTYPIIRVTDFP